MYGSSIWTDGEKTRHDSAMHASLSMYREGLHHHPVLLSCTVTLWHGTGMVLHPAGRKPNVHNLGLEAAGVELNPKNGAIVVNEYSQTTVRAASFGLLW